jgi:XTP/dITP diphosphohydrolase
MDLIFASHNDHKISELKAILPSGFTLKGLPEMNFTDEIPETGLTLVENALIKARTIFHLFGLNTISDDTGLEIEALDGAPGVWSARFAGEENNSQKNMNKVLTLLNDKVNRKAQFKTVIALIMDGNEYLFEGVVKGSILKTPRGKGGFGYDPVFEPEGYDCSFAEMAPSEKNNISHRGRAVERLLNFFKSV